MSPAASTHLVLLPTYNTGAKLLPVVQEVLAHWPDQVLVVVDGSNDGSEQPLLALAKIEPRLAVLGLPKNRGKGAAVLAGAEQAVARGFTHALVMDADGQHPAASIGEFMEASRRRPEAMILGRPVFGPEVPLERLHGRKLSTAMVYLEVLGPAVDDTLFGFRVYPLAPLLAVLGTRRGGRRYDFETEAAVRLIWRGVPTVNLAAPVKYFTRAEGGVSHFHYLRDNLLLISVHTRLILEMLCWRWPAILTHRRRWRVAARQSARAGATFALAVLLTLGVGVAAARAQPSSAGEEPALAAERGLEPVDATAWRDLTDAFAARADAMAEFTERRFFPFKEKPAVLRGEVRVSASRGLSLAYLAPDERIVIVDAAGLALREKNRTTTPPADERSAAINRALMHVLHFDLAALATEFELRGERDGAKWTLSLVPRDAKVAQAFRRIEVRGENAFVERIELRRSQRQFIEITMNAPRPPAAFTAEEIARYFR